MMKTQPHAPWRALPALVLILALIFALMPPSSVLAEQQMTMVVLGDSIAVGNGAPAGLGYAPLVSVDQNMVLVNLSAEYLTTEDVINQLKTDEAAREAVRAADLVQITIGGNDLRQEEYAGPAIEGILMGDMTLWNQHSENIAARFSQIVDLVRDLTPTAPFFVFNSYTPDYKRVGDYDFGSGVTGNLIYAALQNYAIPRFNKTYTSYLEENPGAFILVDIFDAFPDNDSSYYGFYEDIIHPSALGHEQLANRLNTAIGAYNEKHKQTGLAANVEKQSGNQNLLTIEVTETFPLKPASILSLSLPIGNNAAGYYEVGGYTVFVDTKGNTQVKACYILP